MDLDIDSFRNVFDRIIGEIGKSIVGKRDIVKIMVATFLAGGHVLLEGPPGSGKTLLAKSFSRVIGGEFKRVQGNPDILPSDLTGYYIYRLEGERRLVKGPVFTNVLLYDELNRTPPRVQSALLQAMAEKQVSIDGVIHDLPEPFHLVATEIPVEEEFGVYPLTLTLRDRFWVKLECGYNPVEEEVEIVGRSDQLYRVEPTNVEQVVSVEDYKLMSEGLKDLVYVDRRIVEYITSISNAIRSHEYVAQGPSHRGGIYLYRIAKVLAASDGRDYVIPDDVKSIAVPVMAHRIILTPEAEAENVDPERLVDEIVAGVPVPKE